MATVSKDVLDHCGSLSWFASNVLNLKLSPAQLYILSLENAKIQKKGKRKMREELFPAAISDWTKKHNIILNEGEEMCPVCHGNKGHVSYYCKPPGRQWVICKKCNGTGKIDWITKAMM